MRRKKLACLLSFSAVLLATSCVTVYVNFPESAVQKATDDYVKDIYGAKEKGKPSPTPVAPEKTSSLFFEAAYADETVAPRVRLDSKKADEIKQKLRSLIDDIDSGKRDGNLGETKDGFLELHNEDQLKASAKDKPLLMKKYESLRKLVKDVNGERKDLYKEAMKINPIPRSDQARLQASFARSFQAHSPAGTWIQDDDGNWSQK